MAKRFVDTELWQKEWYQDLSLLEKIFVKYVFENCDCAGVWETNYRMASFIIGEKITKDIIDSINDKNFIFEFIAEDKIYVKNFIEFQYGKLSYNCKPHLPIIKLLNKYGIAYEIIDENNLTIKQMRKRLTETAKKNIFNRDKYECQYCGSHDDLEIDHIIPLSKGGTNEDDNLITVCHKCNALKGDKDLKDFINNNKCNIKFLGRVSNILNTLEEKEKEKEKDKEKEKEIVKKVDPFINPVKTFFSEQYTQIMGKTPRLSFMECQRLTELASENPDIREIIPEAIRKLKVLKFDGISFTPSASWLLKANNFERLLNGEFDAPETEYERLKRKFGGS